MAKAQRLERYSRLENPYKTAIIVNPIMRGGIVPEAVQERLIEEGWMKVGYSICFDCLHGRSSLVSKPPVDEFLKDVAEFYGGSYAEHTFGCRSAQYAVMRTIREYANSSGEYASVVVADPFCHYTTLIAAELAGLNIVEAPQTGQPEYRVDPDGFRSKIEEVKKRFGKKPALLLVTHAEPYYGNLNPVEEVGKISEEYGIPYMVNAAYTGGVMPVNMKSIGADFLTISAHKSMASLGPLGFLIFSEEWVESVLRGSEIIAEGSGRSFRGKFPNFFGCSIGGVPLISAMYSFPYVVERVNRWDSELEKVNWFVREMEKIGGIFLEGERPHRHHLMHFEVPIIWEISKYHKRRGFFLAEEMMKRGIVGLQRGISRYMKISLYGLQWGEVEKVRDALQEIVEKYIKEFGIETGKISEKSAER
ncbi:MAG: O-phospho-L-seryl-tRNA:Cys-tRNA synthase [Nitrososphaerota archaeon]|nr:O-phospho-L-seryl-tRNA:Cys-tRNA synthase [Candidatus Bathyarchaeota archaeon]MDW8048702.1 O-phospho-L-seryl-tRNA:Cys-tRNA synthase [Nitrososphaerota archaeon]